jgi:lipid II:glycine glycyltransferase (peptidoglycan interpeptide bridge formation enzyme)
MNSVASPVVTERRAEAARLQPGRMDIVQFDISRKDEWNAFVRTNDHHVFQYYEWADVFSRAYGFEPLYLGVTNDDKELVAVLPLFVTNSLLFGRSLKSMPYHVEGGPVISSRVSDVDLIHRRIHQQIGALQTKYRVRNVDIKTRDEQFLRASPTAVRTYQVYHRYLCDLTLGEDGLFKRFRSDVRNNIRRAQRFGIEAEVGDQPDDIDRFYELYLLWAKGIGLPGHSRRFFRLLWNHFYPQGMARIVFARLHGRLAAAKLFLIDPADGSVLQNWGAIASFALKQTQVNTALLWEEIRWAIANGYRSFDFGVTSERHIGSNYFKAAWNTTKVKVAFANVGDFSRTKVRDDHEAGQLFRVVWKRVPTVVSQHIGPFILRQGN